MRYSDIRELVTHLGSLIRRGDATGKKAEAALQALCQQSTEAILATVSYDHYEPLDPWRVLCDALDSIKHSQRCREKPCLHAGHDWPPPIGPYELLVEVEGQACLIAGLQRLALVKPRLRLPARTFQRRLDQMGMVYKPHMTMIWLWTEGLWQKLRAEVVVRGDWWLYSPGE